MHTRVFFSLLACPLVSLSTPIKPDTALPPLHRHAQVYQSACTSENLENLHESLRASKTGDQKNAWKLITTLLCAPPSTSNKRYLFRALASKVEVISGDLEGETSSIILKSQLILVDLFPKGEAYGPRLSTTPKKDTLSLHYYTDEACVASRDFKLVRRQWRVTSIGFGCD